jgi:hypothetical protein
MAGEFARSVISLSIRIFNLSLFTLLPLRLQPVA